MIKEKQPINYSIQLNVAKCSILHYFQLSHVTVLTGYRMLPRKDLVKVKVYFLIDAACAALAYSFHRVSRGITDSVTSPTVRRQVQHIFGLL